MRMATGLMGVLMERSDTLRMYTLFGLVIMATATPGYTDGTQVGDNALLVAAAATAVWTAGQYDDARRHRPRRAKKKALQAAGVQVTGQQPSTLFFSNITAWGPRRGGTSSQKSLARSSVSTM